MTSSNILFADNDQNFLRTRSEFLEQHGFHIISATGPLEAKQIIEQGQVDLVILDLRLINDDDEKDISGLNVARESSPFMPKIILTKFPTVEAVRDALGPALNGLSPAVDFIDKKEGPQALLTAVRKALKLRRQIPFGSDDFPSPYENGVKNQTADGATGDFLIDYDKKSVIVEGKVVDKLTKLQFRLLTYLGENSNRVCSRDELLHYLYQEDEYDRVDSALDTHISRLRRKIEPDPAHPKYLITVPGHGYQLRK